MTTSGRILIRRRPLSYSSRALNGAGPKGHDRRPGRACHSIHATQRGRGDGAASTGEAWDALHALWVRAAGRAGESVVCAFALHSSFRLSRGSNGRDPGGRLDSVAAAPCQREAGDKGAALLCLPIGQQGSNRTRHARATRAGSLGLK